MQQTSSTSLLDVCCSVHPKEISCKHPKERSAGQHCVQIFAPVFVSSPPQSRVLHRQTACLRSQHGAADSSFLQSAVDTDLSVAMSHNSSSLLRAILCATARYSGVWTCRGVSSAVSRSKSNISGGSWSCGRPVVPPQASAPPDRTFTSHLSMYDCNLLILTEHDVFRSIPTNYHHRDKILNSNGDRAQHMLNIRPLQAQEMVSL